MPQNLKQKIVVLPIAGGTEQTIKDHLLNGYVIQQIVNLQPSINSLLIVYSTPDEI
jgi:hypothetical protein